MSFPILAFAEIFAFVVGLITRVSSKLTLPGRLVLEGKRARAVGLLLMAPLPLSFLAGLLIGGLTSAGSLSLAVFNYSGYIEAGIVLGFVGGALIYAYLTGRTGEPSSASPRPPAAPPAQNP